MSPAPPRQPRPARRRGFTLIELLVSLSLVSIIAAACMSALLLSLRAIPDADDASFVASRVDTAFEYILADVLLAEGAETSASKIALLVPDQTGDANPDTVVYQLEAGRLERVLNGATPTVLADKIASAAFDITTFNGTAASLTVTLKSDRDATHRASFEFLARP